MGLFTTFLNPSNHIWRWEIAWRNAPRIWRDFGTMLPFQTRHTQTKPVLPLSKEHGSQVKDQGRQQCFHNSIKNFPIGIHEMYLYFPDTLRTWTTPTFKLEAAITFNVRQKVSTGPHCVILQKALFIVKNAVRISDLVFILGVVILTNLLSNFHYLCAFGRFFSGNLASLQKKVTKNLFYVLLTVHLDIIV